MSMNKVDPLHVTSTFELFHNFLVKIDPGVYFDENKGNSDLTPNPRVK